MENKFYELHKKYSQGLYPEKWLELTWIHTNIIWEIAQKLVLKLKNQGIKVDMDLLEKGVMLHDLGVYLCFDEDLNPDKSLPQYIYHGFIGADLILKEGFGEEVARFARNHSATGFTIEDIERENLQVEKKDYIPVTVEEEILCYADKFHTKHPSFSTYQEQVVRIAKFDPNRALKMEVFKKKYGIPDLSDLKEKYETWNLKFDNWFTNH